MNDTVIHIVDDDEAVRSAMRLLLRSYGWRSRAFASAEEFLEALVEEVPDCLLLDLNMPGMNGAELLEVLGTRRSAVPVIVVTGEGSSALAARARGAGAEAVLDKPFSEEDLKASIDRILADSH
ncbi:MAG: response regulator [Nevskia sp.]|nr:response regulator [Nevskia sp.]